MIRVLTVRGTTQAPRPCLCGFLQRQCLPLGEAEGRGF